MQLGRYRMRNDEIVTVTKINPDAEEHEDQVEGEYESGAYQAWDINGRAGDLTHDYDSVEFLDDGR